MTTLNLTPSKPVGSVKLLPIREQLPRSQTVSAQTNLIDIKHQTAYLEVRCFGKTARSLFSHDKTLLAYLGLGKRSLDSGSVASFAGGLQPTGSTRSIAAIISRWRQMFINAQKLYNWELEQLAQAGWTAERLAHAVTLIEAAVEVNHK